ncbi:TBC1 domain family member 23 [Trichinella patagoniensis]|uniref:TBC1 domain family member 23 n=1 Tax=Trichinella patagoniensis TaxID=990121 RepID=A0A0V0ZXT8_9BILA|nr:TBC1 domain family member 23 [Trichinella patagoniensis]
MYCILFTVVSNYALYFIPFLDKYVNCCILNLYSIEMSVKSEECSDSDSEWVKDLELAVAADCDFNTVRLLAENRPLSDKLRSSAWQCHCDLTHYTWLKRVSHKPDPFIGHEELFNLLEQHEIRSACIKISEMFGNSESDRLALVSNLESVITLYCKNQNVCFTNDNGWTDILQLLTTLRLSKSELYRVFFTVTTKYIPKDCSTNGKVFDLFRLLLLYHEPELSAFLDSVKISPEDYSKKWFNSLFTSSCKLNVALKILDVYLQQADPFQVFFMALIILINSKNQILLMKGKSKSYIAESIAALPYQLQVDDIEDFYQIMQYYCNRTPQSFRRDFHGPLFGSNFTEVIQPAFLPTLCLPISAQELLPLVVGYRNQGIQLAVIDTRPSNQFSSGHISGAYHLDTSQLLTDPPQFEDLAADMERKIESVFPDAHWCFFSSGLEEDDSICYMCISYFLKRGKRYICMASGGYQVLHHLLKDHLVSYLESHDSKQCFICKKNNSAAAAATCTTTTTTTATATASSIPSAYIEEMSVVSKLDNFENAASSYSASVLKRLKNALKKSENENEKRNAHVKASDRYGQPYRGKTSVFSIVEGDSSEEESDDEFGERVSEKEIVVLEEVLNNSDVLNYFECQQVEKDGKHFETYLVVKEDALLVLRVAVCKKGEAYIMAKHPLDAIHKITSGRMFPELLTFTFFCENDASQNGPYIVERYIVPKSGDCAKSVKQAILNNCTEIQKLFLGLFNIGSIFFTLVRHFYWFQAVYIW